MPAFASITVKKNDGTTDAIYVGKTPAGGEGTDAVWRYDAHAAPYVGMKPELKVSSRYNGPKTARRMKVEGLYKAFATDSTTGISQVVGSIPCSFTCALPVNLPQADIDEAISQFTNLLVSTLIRSSLKEGSAPV